jgi:hypothetical protein
MLLALVLTVSCAKNNGKGGNNDDLYRYECNSGTNNDAYDHVDDRYYGNDAEVNA